MSSVVILIAIRAQRRILACDMETLAFPSSFPRILWMMWSTGLDNAPAVVRACAESWRRHHPDWKIEQLDRARAASMIDVESITGMSPALLDPVVLADLLRVHLLATQGGVWVDATCYCVKPLDEWLPSVFDAGFFAYRNPGPDRILSTWFIASTPGHPLAVAWRDRAFNYWKRHRFPAQDHNDYRHSVLTNCLSSHTHRTRWWFSWPVTRLLRIHPYFWLHYLFYLLVETDREARDRWNEVSARDAKASHALQFEGNGLTRTMDEQTRQRWERRDIPVFKLSHRAGTGGFEPGSPLDLVINPRSSE